MWFFLIVGMIIGFAIGFKLGSIFKDFLVKKRIKNLTEGKSKNFFFQIYNNLLREELFIYFSSFYNEKTIENLIEINSKKVYLLKDYLKKPKRDSNFDDRITKI